MPSSSSRVFSFFSIVLMLSRERERIAAERVAGVHEKADAPQGERDRHDSAHGAKP